MDEYQQIIYKQLVEYNLLTNNVKEKYMVQITYINISTNVKESFWVWIYKINNDIITGIISNILVTNELEIGDIIMFHKKHIKEISDKLYILNNSYILQQRVKNNPITLYLKI